MYRGSNKFGFGTEQTKFALSQNACLQFSACMKLFLCDLRQKTLVLLLFLKEEKINVHSI